MSPGALDELADDLAKQFLLDSLNRAINGGVSFLNICLIFPPEVRKEASEALKRCGYKQSAAIVESLTGDPNLKSLWE